MRIKIFKVYSRPKEKRITHHRSRGLENCHSTGSCVLIQFILKYKPREPRVWAKILTSSEIFYTNT